jgi:hypothetical protein
MDVALDEAGVDERATNVDCLIRAECGFEPVGRATIRPLAMAIAPSGKSVRF